MKCPKCQSELKELPRSLLCDQCQVRYPKEDLIQTNTEPVFVTDSQLPRNFVVPQKLRETNIIKQIENELLFRKQSGHSSDLESYDEETDYAQSYEEE